MAVVSHPALSPEWSFPSPIGPYDAPAFGAHIELPEHTSVVHQFPVVNKRRAHEIEWDDEEEGRKAGAGAKKAKTSPCLAVEPHQLQKDNTTASAPAPSTVPQPQIEQVISIIVDALKSSTSTTSTTTTTTPSDSPPEPPITVLSSNVSVTPFKPSHPTPTSPLSNSPHRAPFVRKVIGGSCSGKTEASLCRWVLCRNHFLSVRCRDPPTQSKEWLQTLHDMGWEELHPYFQAQAASQSADTFGTLSAFSRWIEDEFDYDGTEDLDGDWSDDEEEDGEYHDHCPEDDVPGQTGVWDSGIVLQLPDEKSS